MNGEVISLDQVCELRAIERAQGRGLRGTLQRLIRELTRTPDDKPAPRVFDEEGFEIIKALDYAPDLPTIKAECGFRWSSEITEEHFKRRGFEQGQGEVLTKLHAPNRLISSLEARNELEDMDASGATIREGIAWALSHPVADYPKNVVIALLGSAWQNSDGRLGVPCLCRLDGRWYVSCDLSGSDRWHAGAQFLAVRRKFRR